MCIPAADLECRATREGRAAVVAVECNVPRGGTPEETVGAGEDQKPVADDHDDEDNEGEAGKRRRKKKQGESGDGGEENDAVDDADFQRSVASQMPDAGGLEFVALAPTEFLSPEAEVEALGAERLGNLCSSRYCLRLSDQKSK
jgi:hypothetical protein